MPDDPALEDVFYYGIQGAVHAAGLLCVRVQGDLNDPEVADQAIRRLHDAALVIAEVSEPLYSTYVQLGYSLGRGCPLIAITRDADSLRWKSPHTLVYTSIKGLEQQIAALLPELNLA
ncbi:MAG: hypothetical protein JNL42_01725 [Anaerolineae bacterium]|nr:hypothetical protein [Anaerolineae bacterium]